MLNATAISLYVARNRMYLLCLTIKCLSILRRISAGESRWVTLHFTCFFGNTLPVTLKTFASELHKGRQRDMIRWLTRADVLLLVLLHAAGKQGEIICTKLPSSGWQKHYPRTVASSRCSQAVLAWISGVKLGQQNEKTWEEAQTEFKWNEQHWLKGKYRTGQNENLFLNNVF